MLRACLEFEGLVERTLTKANVFVSIQEEYRNKMKRACDMKPGSS